MRLPGSRSVVTSSASNNRGLWAIARAIATLFNTPVGSNVSVAPAQLSTVRFSTVSTSGLTSVVAVDHAAAVVPSAYEIIRGLDYNVLTTASVSGETVSIVHTRSPVKWLYEISHNNPLWVSTADARQRSFSW